jgi:hypothetical protein
MVVGTRLTDNEVKGLRSHRLRSAGNSANVKPLRLRLWRPQAGAVTLPLVHPIMIPSWLKLPPRFGFGGSGFTERPWRFRSSLRARLRLGRLIAAAWVDELKWWPV